MIAHRSLAAILAVLLTACTASPSSSPPAQETPGVPTGELRIALSDIGAEVTDPTTAPGNGIQAYLPQLYDYLIGGTGNTVLSKERGIAKDWTVAHTATGSTYTVELRQGVKFHDGTELTSADVKFSIEYGMRPESQLSLSPSFRSFGLKVEAPEPYKVIFTTNKLYTNLLVDLSRFGTGEGYVLPKAYFERVGAKEFNQHPIGTGPYKFASQVSGSSITYEAIAGKHWLYGVPKYAKVSFLKVPEESTRLAMLKTGEAEIVEISRNAAASVQQSGFTTFANKDIAILGLRMPSNWDQSTYLSDIRVREALNLTIDRPALLNGIFLGQGAVTGDSYYGNRAYGYQAQPLYPLDVPKARTLVEAAMKERGWSKIELTLNAYPLSGLPEVPKMDEAIVSMWNTALAPLVTVKLANVDRTVNRADNQAKKLKNVLFSHDGTNGSFYPEWRAIYHSTGQATVLQDKQIDSLLDTWLNEQDLEKKGQLQVQITKYVRDNHLIVPLLVVSALWAGDGKKITKWDMGNFRSGDVNFLGLMVRVPSD